MESQKQYPKTEVFYPPVGNFGRNLTLIVRIGEDHSNEYIEQLTILQARFWNFHNILPEGKFWRFLCVKQIVFVERVDKQAQAAIVLKQLVRSDKLKVAAILWWLLQVTHEEAWHEDIHNYRFAPFWN